MFNTSIKAPSIHYILDSYIEVTKILRQKVRCFERYYLSSGYKTAHGSLNLKPYSTTSCNVTIPHNENAVRLGKN